MEQRRQDNKVNKLIKDIKHPLAILALHHQQTLNCSSDRRVGLRQLRRHLRRYQDWYFRRRLHASRPLFVNLDEWFLVAFQEVKLETNCFDECLDQTRLLWNTPKSISTTTTTAETRIPSPSGMARTPPSC